MVALMRGGFTRAGLGVENRSSPESCAAGLLPLCMDSMRSLTAVDSLFAMTHSLPDFARQDCERGSLCKAKTIRATSVFDREVLRMTNHSIDVRGVHIGRCDRASIGDRM